MATAEERGAATEAIAVIAVASGVNNAGQMGNASSDGLNAVRNVAAEKIVNRDVRRTVVRNGGQPTTGNNVGRQSAAKKGDLNAVASVAGMLTVKAAGINGAPNAEVIVVETPIGMVAETNVGQIVEQIAAMPIATDVATSVGLTGVTIVGNMTIAAIVTAVMTVVTPIGRAAAINGAQITIATSGTITAMIVVVTMGMGRAVSTVTTHTGMATSFIIMATARLAG